MATTLLATKLFIPPVAPNLVLRPRLMQRLLGVLNSRLVLVSAPAGFGKTTLLSQWSHSCHIPITWLSLEEAENDPVRFWDYLIAALRKIAPTIGETTLAQLHSSQPVHIESTLTTLINDIATISGDLILVLDDYHFIQSEAVHKGVTFLLEHLPTKMHIVIATREDPPLPLARFRGKGMLLDIRVDDLRFTPDEVIALLAGMGGPILSTASVAALNTRTEGWVAGLKMAVLSMQNEKDVEKFVSGLADTQRYIMDYLIEEVLERQPAIVCDFLLQTSVLERLFGPLCNTLTGRDDGEKILLSLGKANLFIVPLDNSMAWYRYHHLFRDLLHHHLRVELGEAGVKSLHLKASQWYEKNGYVEDAINHALAGHDWEKAMDLVASIKPNPSSVYGNPTTVRWLRSIPRDVLATRGQICGYYAWALAMTGQLSAAAAFIDSFGELGQPWIGQVAVGQAQIAYLRGDSQAEEYAKKALTLLPTSDVFNRGVAAILLAGGYLSRARINEAEPLVNDVYESWRKAGLPATDCLAMLAMITLFRGKLSRAEGMFKQILASQEGQNNVRAHLWMSAIYCQRNDLGTANSELEKAKALHPDNPEMLFDIRIQAITNRFAQGNIDSALKTLEEAEHIAGDNASARKRLRIAGWHIVLAATQNDPLALSRWLDEFLEYREQHMFGVPALAIFLACERGSKAFAEKLNAEYEYFRKEGVQVSLNEVRLAQALSSTRSEESLSFLGEVLKATSPERQVRVFADVGMLLAPLLRRAIRSGIEPEYARMLLNIIEAEERQRKIIKGEISTSPTTGLLSEREVEVLRLLADGLSDQEIAAKLIISLYTAKTHVRHVFDKLGVRGRTQAIARGRELKLL